MQDSTSFRVCNLWVSSFSTEVDLSPIRIYFYDWFFQIESVLFWDIHVLMTLTTVSIFNMTLHLSAWYWDFINICCTQIFNISFLEAIYEIYSSLKCVYKIDIVIPFWDHCPWVRLSLKRHKTLKLNPPTLNFNNSIMSSFIHVHVFDIYTTTLLVIKYWTKCITESRTADRTFFFN